MAFGIVGNAGTGTGFSYRWPPAGVFEFIVISNRLTFATQTLLARN
jgi:hypothetical protein